VFAAPVTRVPAVLLLLLACEAPRARPSDAYVWNRSWTPAVREAIAARPPELQALRVLVLETGAEATLVALDEQALIGLRVVPVLRVGQGLPDEGTWARFLARARALRALGVTVTQVEVDYDAPTEGLGAYLAWLEATRPSLGGLARSITALPTWAGAPQAAALSRAADEVVLQVHSVRAPVLFDARAAVVDAQRWARATGRPFRVALPAYRTRLASGEALAAEPAEVARVWRALGAEPLVRGFVFFRLGNAADRDAWSPQTLHALLARQPLEAFVTARAIAVEGSLVDVWLENDGPVDALAPERLSLQGTLEDAVATTGYQRRDASFVTGHPLWLRPGERLRIGSARGANLRVVTP
jgi:hypothetical protein